MNDDASLFKKMMADVTPLRQGKPRHHDKKKPAKIKIQLSNDDSKPLPPLSDFIQHEVDAETLISGGEVHIFKKMPFKINATLDLHGLTKEAARVRLIDFINLHQQKNHRQLLIIHGKGGRFHEKPVLKNLVHQWLKQLNTILAWKSAPAQHGGSGALWVILRHA